MCLCVGSEAGGRGGSCTTEVALEVTNNGPHISCSCQNPEDRTQTLGGKGGSCGLQLLFEFWSDLKVVFPFFPTERLIDFFSFSKKLILSFCDSLAWKSEQQTSLVRGLCYWTQAKIPAWKIKKHIPDR